MLISIIAIIIVLCYILQLREAIINRPRTEITNSNSWTTVGMIFVVPVLISITVSVIERQIFGPSNDLGTRQFSLSLIPSWQLAGEDIADILVFIQSMLLVFISLEMSHVTVKSLEKKWRDLLIIALVLDVVSIILIFFIKSITVAKVDLAVILGLFSLCSSFVIVMLARKAIELKLVNKSPE